MKSLTILLTLLTIFLFVITRDVVDQNCSHCQHSVFKTSIYKQWINMHGNPIHFDCLIEEFEQTPTVGKPAPPHTPVCWVNNLTEHIIPLGGVGLE